MGFREWKNGTKRICSDCGRIFYCDPKHSKECRSFPKGKKECHCGDACDLNWRKETDFPRAKQLNVPIPDNFDEQLKPDTFVMS